MGFLSGRFSCERFRVEGVGPKVFAQQHLKTLKKYAIGEIEASGEDQINTGFLAGRHIFDVNFHPERNIINDALHFALRIDVNQVPSSLRKAWIEIELAALAADNPSGRPTKAQRQQAKESVDSRCAEEAATGRYRKMRQFPVLWDARQSLLYFGSSSPAIIEHFTAIFGEAFELELTRLSAGEQARNSATTKKQQKQLADIEPTLFHAQARSAEIQWVNQAATVADYLGNEFLVWLWWWLETHSETIELADETTVTAMISKSLLLECPAGESGKDTFSAEMPTRLPEAAQAIRTGKLPRKCGMTLVRQGEQYDLVLQPESLSWGGAGIQLSEEGTGRSGLEDRIDQIRRLSETLDLLFDTFCRRRLDPQWDQDVDQIRKWLKSPVRTARSAA